MNSVLIKSAEQFGLDSEKIKRKVNRFLKERLNRSVEVSLLFVGKATIRKLNQKYRNLEKATSVLSFFQGQAYPQKPAFSNRLVRTGRKIPDERLIIGDVVICPEIAKEQDLETYCLIEHGIKSLLSQISTTKNFRIRPGRHPRRFR